MFTNISFDIIKFGISKYTEPEDLLSLCLINKSHYRIFLDKKMWLYLLKKHYNVKCKEINSKKKYKRYYKSLLKNNFQEYDNFSEIHYLTDILVNKILSAIQDCDVTYWDIKCILKYIGYVKRGDKFIWSNIKNFNIEKDAFYHLVGSMMFSMCGVHNSLCILYGSDIFKITDNYDKYYSKVLNQILPSIFESEGNDIYISHICFSRIYDYFNGKGELLGRFENYLFSNNGIEYINRSGCMKEMKKLLNII